MANRKARLFASSVAAVIYRAVALAKADDRRINLEAQIFRSRAFSGVKVKRPAPWLAEKSKKDPFLQVWNSQDF